MDRNKSQETLAPLLPAATSDQVEIFSQAALERIKNRRDAEERVGIRNHQEFVSYIEESLISHYTKREDQTILMNWKRELLELLHLPLPNDPEYNFQSSNSSYIRRYLHDLGSRLKDHSLPATLFSQNASLSARKCYNAMSKDFVSPEGSHYYQLASILNPYAHYDKRTILDHYEKSDHKQVKKTIQGLADYLYKSNWYLKHPDNWERISEEFDQLKQGDVKLFDRQGRTCTMYQPKEFVKSLNLVPNPNPSALRRFGTFAPSSDHFKSLQHHRVTRRYALISGVRTYGTSQLGGQSLVPL